MSQSCPAFGPPPWPLEIRGSHSANLQTKKAVADVVFVSITNIFYSSDNPALFRITLRSVPRPIADSNIWVEYKPRLTNLGVRNLPGAVAEVGRALFGTGEQTVKLAEMVRAPSHWVKSLCWCCCCWCCGCCRRPLSCDKCCFCGVVL